ncbi:MAG: SRPBCC family protein [Ginsengibacter sp.]
MKTFYYKAEQLLPINIDLAWHFFSSAKNLTLITPPELDFEILTLLHTTEIYEGMLIDYTVRPLLGIRLKWQTEICKVEKPLFFTDRQVKGPYQLWEHTHTFVQKHNGVLMKDEVKYKLRFGIVGIIMNSLVVHKKIKKIFNFRKDILTKIFQKNANNNH